MKKLLVPLILALFLCACTVGPEETPHNDILNPQSPSASDRPDVSAPAVSSQDVSSEPEPGEEVGETASEDMPIPDEPEDVLEIPDEPEISDTAEPDAIDVELFDEPVTMSSTISLNVRSGPSTDYEPIGIIEPDDKVTAFGESDGWYAITYNEATGFVSAKYMKAEESSQLDPLDHAAAASIIEAYARLDGRDPKLVALGGYFGEYGGGFAVLMYSDSAEGFEDYDFGYCTFELDLTERLLYYKNGEFTPLGDAKAAGDLSGEDIKTIHRYFEEMRKNDEESNLSLPELEPLSARQEDSLAKDWIEQYCGGEDPGGVRAARYFGTYGGSEVVVMTSAENAANDVESAINIAGYIIRFWDSNQNILLHRGHEFFPLETAYLYDYISDEDLARISYYSGK